MPIGRDGLVSYTVLEHTNFRYYGCPSGTLINSTETWEPLAFFTAAATKPHERVPVGGEHEGRKIDWIVNVSGIR